MKRMLKRVIPPSMRRSILLLMRSDAPTYYATKYGPQKGTQHYHFSDHRELLFSGEVLPETRRIAALVLGDRVLELGAGEGLLALAVAHQHGTEVRAIDMTPTRVEAGRALRDVWVDLGLIRAAQVDLVLGDVFDHLDLLDDVDTVVASRFIYYLHDRIDALLTEVAAKVPTVVLIGNRNRAERWRSGGVSNLGKYEFYATEEGMMALLSRHGYAVTAVHGTFDPVVVGRRLKMP